MSDHPPPGQGGWQPPPAQPPSGQRPGGYRPADPAQGGWQPPPAVGYGSTEQPPARQDWYGDPPAGDPVGPRLPGPSHRQPRRRSAALAVLGVVCAIAVVIGVGATVSYTLLGSDDDDYCALLDTTTARFGPLFIPRPSPDDNEERVEAIHQLREAAPDEVADTWASLDDPLQEFQAVLDDEGVTWEDLENGVEPEPTVQAAIERLDSALEGYDVLPITHHANDVCSLDLTELYN